jgi:hypothetical protein
MVSKIDIAAEEECFDILKQGVSIIDENSYI